MWYREKDSWKNARYTASDMSKQEIDEVKERRHAAWREKQPLAEMYGFEAKDYDLSDEVKKITHFRPKVVGGAPIIEKETFYMDRPFRYDRELSNSERKMLPLPITSCCKWVGLTKFAVGAWEQKIREPLGWFDGFLRSEYVDPLISGKAESTYSKYSLVEGSWATNHTLLKEMAKPPTPKISASVYELLDYSLDRYHKFGFPQIGNVIEKWWLKAVTLNSEANPGLVSRRELGSDKRRAYAGALEIARSIWDKIVTNRHPICDSSLWSVGGRARKQDFAKGKAPESRIVLMPEMPNSFIASVIAQPIIKEMKKVLQVSPDKECFMGQDVTLGGWSRIRDFTTPGTPVLELDWKKFDSTIMENVMVASFCLLRTCFPVSKKIDKIFLFVMSSFIYKNIAIKQRFIYKITRGIPSGSPLTSLMVTVCNWVCLNYVLRKEKLFGINGPDDYKLGVAGDDTLIAFLKHQEPGFILNSAKEVCDAFDQNCNLKAEPEDLNYNEWFGGESSTLDDIEFAPSLLKTTIYYGIPGRRFEDLVKAISCPESKVCDYWDVLAVLKGYTSIPVYNPYGRALLVSLGKFVSDKLREREGLQDLGDIFDPFSSNTYLPRAECMVVFTDEADRMLRDPPYLRKDKWNGEEATGRRKTTFQSYDLEMFGVPN